MDQNNPQFYDYFLKELELLLETCITHDLSRGSGIKSRASTLFSNGSGGSEEDTKYSIDFMTMLQESYKIWGTSLDENIQAAEKLIERFYELLDKGAIEFTDKNIFYGKDVMEVGLFNSGI